MNKRVTICVLMYGNYPTLARQGVESILSRCDREQFQLVVGCNPWIRAQPWYVREPIPCDASGKWVFVIGASWFARMSALKQLNWPPVSFIKAGDAAIFCEAIRQSGLSFEQIGECGVKFQTHDRRAPETKEMMLAQMKLP